LKCRTAISDNEPTSRGTIQVLKAMIMESGTEQRFAIVQDAYKLEKWLIVAGLLTEILGVPEVTARHQARQSRGFLATDLPQGLAERLKDACVGQGIAVHVVPQGEIIPAIKLARVHQVWITDDALCVQLPGSEAKTQLDWETVRLMAVTTTTRKESFQHWPTPVRDPVVTQRMTTKTEKFAEQLADVLSIPIPGVVFGVRLFSWQVNYAEALGGVAPDALRDINARTNSFCRLLSAIAARATRVYIPPGSQALLEASFESIRPLPDIPLDEFEAYNRWLLQRLCLESGNGLR